MKSVLESAKTSLATKKTFRLGLIGCGSKGLDHLNSICSSQKASLVAVADSQESNLNSLACLNKVNLYTDYKELLNNETLDAVVICVPHHLHLPIALEAFNKGLHVFMEKPLALNLSEAKQILKRSQSLGKVFMVGTQRRLERSFSMAKELLPEIGHLFSFRYSYHISCDLDNLGWRGLKSSAGGGPLVDMGYHAVDILTWYCGLPDSVFLYDGKLAGPTSSSEVEDTALLSFSFKNSALGYIFLSRGISPEDETLRVSGDKGSLIVKRGLVQLYKKGLLDPVVEVKDAKSKKEIYQDQLKIFLDCLERNQVSNSGISENILNMAIVEAGYLSQEKNAPINPKELLT